MMNSSALHTLIGQACQFPVVTGALHTAYADLCPLTQDAEGNTTCLAHPYFGSDAPQDGLPPAERTTPVYTFSAPAAPDEEVWLELSATWWETRTTPENQAQRGQSGGVEILHPKGILTSLTPNGASHLEQRLHWRLVTPSNHPDLLETLPATINLDPFARLIPRARLNISEPGIYEVELAIVGDERTRVVVDKARFLSVDLDIDSDNTDGDNVPSRTAYEDYIEDIEGIPGIPGKIILVNTGDRDNDGVPNFADGFRTDAFDHREQEAGGAFVPLVLALPQHLDHNAKVRFHYDASDPALVQKQTTRDILRENGDILNAYTYLLPDEGHLRLWTRPGAAARNGADANAGGDYINPSTDEHPVDYPVSVFERIDGKIVLYVEGVKASSEVAAQRIDIDLDPFGNGEFLEEVDAVRVTVAEIGWIDEYPDYARVEGYHTGESGDDGDSDNYFLRHRVWPQTSEHSPNYSAECAAQYDDEDLNLWYRILPDTLSRRQVQINIYEEVNTDEAGDDLLVTQFGAGEQHNQAWHVRWDGKEIRDLSAAEVGKHEFRPAGFYRVQLDVALDGGSEEAVVFTTSIDDGDADLPGWQCPQDGLAIHDLAYKHRPDVYVGSGEEVAPNGPVHPFAEIEDHYRLVNKDGEPAWKKQHEQENSYHVFGSFPEVKEPIVNSSYEVLTSSMTNDPPTAEHHIQRIFILTKQSFEKLNQSETLPEMLVQYLQQQMEDKSFPSEEALLSTVKFRIWDAVPYLNIDFAEITDYAQYVVKYADSSYIYNDIYSGGSSEHYLDLRDPRTVSVLTQQSFDILREEGTIPEETVSCIEDSLKDQEIEQDEGMELLWRVREHLEKTCDISNYEQRQEYAYIIWRTSKEHTYYENRNYKAGIPYLLHRGHPHVHPNHVFIQYWQYMTSSHSPYNTGQIMDNAFNHEADWEMVQITLRLTNPEFPAKKMDWLLPYAATAAQHHYGQTLAWRIARDGDQEMKERGQTDITQEQRYTLTTENGNRIKIYIAENAHATYFRNGKIDADVINQRAGIQVQYQPASKCYDEISGTPPERQDGYKLLALDDFDGKGMYDWPAYWGLNVRFGPNVRSPKFSSVKDLQGEVIIKDLDPTGFHQSCRKLVDINGNFDKQGSFDPETELLP